MATTKKAPTKKPVAKKAVAKKPAAKKPAVKKAAPVRAAKAPVSQKVDYYPNRMTFYISVFSVLILVLIAMLVKYGLPW